MKIGRAEWKNTKYVVSLSNAGGRTRKVLQQEIIGSYTQFPLRLGWALTVHKSQGQDYDCCNLIEPHRYWADGQLYVAISRCRHISRLFYEGNLNKSMLRTSDDVKAFYRNLKNKEE